MSRLAAWLLLLPLLLASGPAAAQTPAKETRFVYGLNVFTGAEYTSHVAPPAVDTVYVLADHDSVLDPKLTEVYFWPITNEYRVDFTSLDELVPGRLEVVQSGRPVATLDLTEYVVQFDRAREMAGGRMHLGPAAGAAWRAFEAERAAYLQRQRAYAEASQAFLADMEALRRRADAGEKVVAPEPPTPPAPLTLYSTEVGRGFPVRLPPGRYEIQLRDGAGRVVPDSRKALVAVAPRREGVAYEVVPEEKWTTPEPASDPSNTIYTRPGGVVYLRPFRALEFNALEHARLLNPQDRQATANRWRWVNVAPIEGAALVVRAGDREERRPIEHFAVEQVPGAALGYRVRPFEPRPDDRPPGAPGERRPDLVAYRVEAPPGPATLRLRLVDADGRELPGGQRDLVANAGAPDWQLALPVLLPLALGVTVALWRREQLQSARALPPEQRRLLA